MFHFLVIQIEMYSEMLSICLDLFIHVIKFWTVIPMSLTSIERQWKPFSVGPGKNCNWRKHGASYQLAGRHISLSYWPLCLGRLKEDL